MRPRFLSPAALLLVVFQLAVIQVAQAQESEPSRLPVQPPLPPVVDSDLFPDAPLDQETPLDEGASPDSAKPDNPCDAEKMQALEKQIAGAYKPLFYDNDFNYLCDPCYDQWWPGQNFKRIGLGDAAILDIGGQYRTRYQSEHNMRGLGLTGLSDDFLLHRTRVYGNLEVRQNFRAYVEYLDAVSNHEQFNPRPIEENRSDLLNAFADLLVFEGETEFWLRAGRQELLYGNQRLVSPLDWANTRRTFQGYKAMLDGGDWRVDGFWTNPVDPDTDGFDSPNRDEEFMGVYATKKLPDSGKTIDLFYLRLHDEQAQGNFPNNFDVHTIGSRIEGKYNDFDYECWGAYQFGKNTDGTSHVAGAFTLGVGRTFDDYDWKPALWLYYDWASGADQTGAVQPPLPARPQIPGVHGPLRAAEHSIAERPVHHAAGCQGQVPALVLLPAVAKRPGHPLQRHHDALQSQQRAGQPRTGTRDRPAGDVQHQRPHVAAGRLLALLHRGILSHDPGRPDR